ncbi:MAG: MBOAT family protein [Ruminococcaceae bacterium]|nr:MBOAT family protein [Oscillospiraceae bacterium]
MVFSSMFFILVFLVLCYGVYLFGKTMKQKNIILLISSLIFYAWGGPALCLLLCLETFICFGGALIIEKYKSKRLRLGHTWITVCACLALLVFFKYTGFFASNFINLFGLDATAPSIVLPIGISFYTFQLISYVIDVYRGEIKAQKAYWKLLLYASLFHQCIAGPIVRYADIEREIENRDVSLETLSRGFSRFAVGLAKKAILANGCAAIADALLASDRLQDQSSLGIILGVFAYALQLYLDFSAYSDMAIGMGLMVGFHYKENFNYPYVSHSVTDFWRRWHISLSSFFRDYVYIPLGGNRVSLPRHVFNLFVVWALTGFWHGASWNFVLWGIFYFVFLALEKFVFKFKAVPTALTRIPRTLYTLVVVFLGTMLFKFTSLKDFGIALGSMFGANSNGFSGMQVQSQFSANIFLLIVSVLACTPIVPFVTRLMQKNKYTQRVSLCIGAVVPAMLIILSLIALAGDSYNPFIYFQF